MANTISSDAPTATSTGERPPTITLSEEEYSKLLQYQTAHQASLPTASLAHQGKSIACLSTPSPSPSWILDSGASNHMSGNSTLFSGIQYSASLPAVTLANGATTSVTGVGTVTSSSSLSLNSVFFVPSFPFNLMSVSQLTKQHHCSVTFFPNSVIIQDMTTREKIGRGHEAGGVYYLDASQTCPTIKACPAVASPIEVHCRLGHPSLDRLKSMVPSLSHLQSLNCESCQLGKHHRVPFASRNNKRSSSLFSLVHSDVWGPSRVVSKLGFRYFVTFVDDFSRMTWLYLMKDRSELLSIFQAFCAEIKTQFDLPVRILRSDNAKEYFSKPFADFMTSCGMLHQSSCSNTPQQNGVAERKNLHLIETARCLLFQMNVPKIFWSDAVLSACYLINRMPSSVLKGETPHTVLFPNKPLFSLPPRIFGCISFVHQLAPGIDKLDARAHKCIFLGYSRLQKGYRCFNPSLNRFFVCADVTFFESTPFFSQPQSPSSLNDSLPLPVIPIGTIPASPSGRLSRPDLQVYSRRQEVTAPPSTSHAPPTVSPVPPDSVSDLEVPIALRKGTRSCTSHPISHFVSYDALSPSYQSFVTSLSSVSIPNTVSEALSHSGWHSAMNDEMSALRANDTWDLVTLPPGKSVVGCRWIYTVKFHPDGNVDRLKARLVAKGYTQVYGLDFSETFSPVAKITSVRLLISLAAVYHWPLHQLDVKNAFLHGDLAEEVYMEQPPGFVAQGESGLVCKLKKSLYGLKQSPRAWFGRFSTVVTEFGLSRCGVDHSVFYRHTSKGKIWLLVYVDDIIITGDDVQGIADLKMFLQSKFSTKALGPLRYFLGIEVARSHMGISLSQRKYVLDLLTETGMLGCKPVDTPMDPNTKLIADQGEVLHDPSQYRRIVGKLNYLTVTRPDISFATSVISQFLESPRTSHWDAVVRILRYLKNAPGKGLLYKNNQHTLVQGYTDADWAGSPSDRRSTTGYCVFVGGNLVSWKSKKQTVVARSSAESEYRAMAHTSCELIWIQHMLKELGVHHSQPMELLCDNQAAIHIASNPVFHERTKHIEIDCHFVREKILQNVIKTNHVKSEDQLADLFTKALGGPRIRFICNKLGTYDIYAPA